MQKKKKKKKTYKAKQNDALVNQEKCNFEKNERLYESETRKKFNKLEKKYVVCIGFWTPSSYCIWKKKHESCLKYQNKFGTIDDYISKNKHSSI